MTETQSEATQAELYRHMKAVAEANGFDSLTQAIAIASNAQAKIEQLRADKVMIIDLIDVALRYPPQKAINTLRDAVRQARTAQSEAQR